jgi:hypothetical protein
MTGYNLAAHAARLALIAPMLLYFYLLRAAFFRECLRPALVAAWRRRSFVPCRELCAQVVATSVQHVPPDAILRQVSGGLPFAREFWHALVGEVILFGAQDMPLVQASPQTLCCLLAPEQYCAADVPRAAFAPIQQVHFGSRDLAFGGAYYRPDRAGYNDETDVRRLTSYLEGVDPAAWHEEMLQPIAELPTASEREEELAFVRDWWTPLVDVYRSAIERSCIVVCEEM